MASLPIPLKKRGQRWNVIADRNRNLAGLELYRRPDLDWVHPLKPDNAGGGKGPQFKTGAIRSEGPGDWATYQLR